MKYIFVTGGVCSGLGKGITAASIGRMLKDRGYKIKNQKLDPYINVDPGTMNPCEHGEVFVTDDGAETDLDLGHYERFTDESLDVNSSITTGKIYKEVIDKERRGDYLGKTVQVIPHITNEIKRRIRLAGKDADIVITELGGTIGDIEGLPFDEAIRQIGTENDSEDVCYIHVTLLPFISGSNELKTKPTQHSIKQLQSLGIRPDILVCRCDSEIDDSIRKKLALFCSVKEDNIIENRTVNNLYEVPEMLEEEGLFDAIAEKLNLSTILKENHEWDRTVENIKKCNGLHPICIENINGELDVEACPELKIAIAGKYTSLADSYISVAESLIHAGYSLNRRISIHYLNTEHIDDDSVGIYMSTGKYDAVVVPGGFGNRGIEGMISVIKYCRENNIPFLGICLGMQLAVIEFIRNVVALGDVNSEEFKRDCKNPVIHIMDDQINVTEKGGTMRLGSYPCVLFDEELMDLYNGSIINERHRHRYEVNNKYRQQMEDNGLRIVGLSPDQKLVEMVKLNNHPYFVGCQFHPEFKSRPNRPAPLFVGLIKACLGEDKNWKTIIESPSKKNEENEYEQMKLEGF